MVRKFVIYHPILTYFARDYQLEQLAIEEEGREPSAAQLKSLIERARKEKSFKDNPEMARKFVIYHPILTYFARDYQLEQLAIEEEGREPSAAQLKSLIERARKEKIKYCLIQAEFANRNTTTFINESHTKPMDINPLQRDWNWAMQEAAAAVQGKDINPLQGDWNWAMQEAAAAVQGKKIVVGK